MENKAGLRERIDWPRKYGKDRDGIARVGEKVQKITKGRTARL